MRGKDERSLTSKDSNSTFILLRTKESYDEYLCWNRHIKAPFRLLYEGKVYRFDNNNSGHLNFIKHLPEGAWVVMECTGTYGHRLAETLVGHGFLVSMVNALQVKRFAQSRFKRAKTDKADAKILTEYAQSLEQCHDDRDRLRLWIPEKSSQIFHKQLRTVYEMLVQVRTMMSNQLEALEGYPMVIPMARQTLQSLLKTMNIKINAIEDAMNTIVDENYPDESKNLESIPGIARKSAIVIIAAVGDIQRFTDAKAFAAFAGLAPRVIESGSSVRGRGILSHYGVTGSVANSICVQCLLCDGTNNVKNFIYDSLLRESLKNLQSLLSLISSYDKFMLYSVIILALTLNTQSRKKMLDN